MRPCLLFSYSLHKGPSRERIHSISIPLNSPKLPLLISWKQLLLDLYRHLTGKPHQEEPPSCGHVAQSIGSRIPETETHEDLELSSPWRVSSFAILPFCEFGEQALADSQTAGVLRQLPRQWSRVMLYWPIGPLLRPLVCHDQQCQVPLVTYLLHQCCLYMWLLRTTLFTS